MKRNVIEWVVLLASLAGIAVVVGVLLVEGLSESAPADPAVQLRQTEARSGGLGWIVPATVSNAGDEPAEVVVIQAETTVAGESETSEVTLDYLPAGSQIEIAFGFSAQPESEISTRLVSFQVP